MRKLLFALSGAQPEILSQCPTEQIKFESLGWAILITSGIATVSMWFALDSAMGLNPFLALLVALVWGLVIMGIDRWLVTSMPADGTRRLRMAIPRLVLALLLGSLISTPIVLRIFQSEINAQITVIKQQRASSFLVQQENSQVGKQVAYWRNDVANLQKVIDSGGDVPLNPSADPVVQSLTRQRTAEVALKQQYYRQWQCQLYGGPGCPRGNGPLAKASEASYNQASATLAALTSRIQQRENQLSASDAASKRARYQQAASALPGAQQQLSAAIARQNALQQSFDAQNAATNGLLIRLQALNALSSRDFTVNAARLLLFLLFLVIECLPVTVKLMQRPGNYEAILLAAAEQERSRARKAYRDRPKAVTLGASAATLPLPGAGQRERSQSVRAIWEPTKEMPRVFTGGMETRPPPRSEADRGQSEDRAVREDTALREMEDLRASTDTGRRTGGTPLHYEDDEL